MIFKRYLRRILQIDVNHRTSLDCHILLGKADYIFVDDFHPLIYTVRFRPSQEVIQVWHAVGAFKTVGFSRTGKSGPFIDSLNHRSYTKAYVSSETDIPFYAEAFGIKKKNVFLQVYHVLMYYLMKLMRHKSNKRWKMNYQL